MSNEENKDVIDTKPYSTIFFIGMIVFFSIISVYMINVFTVEPSTVSAPCELIQSSTPLPDNVVTKGYDIIRNDAGEYIGDECYYIKNAGIIERLVYNWDLLY